MAERVNAYIALGSNLGDRRVNLDEAIACLRAQPGIEVARVSSYHETLPVGGPPAQPPYLNAAAHVRTTFDALQLFLVLQAIEKRLGRTRGERFGPRTIDLDLLLFDVEVVQIESPDGNLTVPHPRMHDRLFVLEPLVEIAPLAVHPVLRSTAYDLLRRRREPTRELLGQHAVVLGSTSGIGRSIALTLADAGANVLIHGRRSNDAAKRLAEECRDKAVWAQSILADLSDEQECAKLVQFAWELWPAIDIWVQCAGADTLTGEAAKWSFERKLEELWAVDVRATIVMTRAAGARMKAQGRGVIVTMGWDQADTGMEGDSGQLFGAVKSAVMAFTKSLALELAPEVRVNCIAPGWIRTAWGEQASRAWQERVLRETPLKRWGTPEDVAAAVRWLVSPDAQFITGQVIRINGGVV
jgi:2-amino-4-hydroxy-6-hydroxymethyldihydropteridine diphosphokinase